MDDDISNYELDIDALLDGALIEDSVNSDFVTEVTNSMTASGYTQVETPLVVHKKFSVTLNRMPCAVHALQ